MPPLSSWKMPLVSPRQSRANVSPIVERKFVRIDALAGRLLDEVDGLGENRQVAQAEEIHLQQAGALDVAHRPLRDDFVFAVHPLQRHVFDQRPVGDHHRGGVRAHVASQPLDLHRQIEQLADFAIFFIGVMQVGALLRAHRDSVMPNSSGTIATTASTRGIGQPQSAADVANRRPGGLSVPNVPICATFASPYLSFTY